MMVAVLLLVLGISLSAFFSGAETGFYRVTRVSEHCSFSVKGTFVRVGLHRRAHRICLVGRIRPDVRSPPI